MRRRRELSNIDLHRLGARVDARHELDLVPALVQVVLANADGVDPELAVRELASQAPEGVLAVDGHLVRLIADLDGPGPGRVARLVGPSVGHGLVFRVQGQVLGANFADNGVVECTVLEA